ncbi:PBECR3 domain-containing polyvalent protein, partial [Campylobacter upsaliensis]|uniref:PBECR3 domain-containing polyvalent protein n=1 Tax=Campylobacter upsaliensis TaxID=28080 RepID=UPI00214A0280
DKSIQAYFKLRENKDIGEIWGNDTYRALAALVNLRDNNTALRFAFRDLNGKIEGFKAYPRKQDLLFNDLTLGNDFKNAMLLSTKNKQLKEKLIEKLKTYIDEKLYRDFLEYKVKDLESKNPKNSILEGLEDFKFKKWDEEAFESYKKELEDLRANERGEKGEKLEDKIKEKESVKESERVLESDLLDKTKPLRKAEKEELTKEVLEQVQKENLKLYLNHTNENLTHFLKLEKPLKITMRGANIKHILNKHGENSTLAKNGQPFVSLEDIKNYDEYINNADKQILKENDKGEKTLLSGKQINGYYIVISSVRLKNGELKLKTMYKENGKLENNEAFKGVKLPSETPSVLQGQSLTTNLDGYPSHAGESIAQNRPKALNLQEIEQALKARISQINDEILAIERTFEDKAFREKLKEASKAKPILEALKKEWKALEPVIVTWTHTDYSKFKPKKYYNRKPNLSNLWHIEETLDVYKGYARENERQAKQVEREITLLEKYVKLLKDKEAEAKKLETDKKALLTESYIIPVYNKLREAFKNGQHTTEQILEAKNIDIKRDSFIAKGIINEIAQLRQYLEHTFNITPLKEFGTNYAEFYKDGVGAIQKLMAEKGGQVSGAFYKEGLGEIDLVWGDSKKGLQHIIERRMQDFIEKGFSKAEAEQKALEFAKSLSDIIENGSIDKGAKRVFLDTENERAVIALDYNGSDGKWILTAYIKDDKAPISAYPHQNKLTDSTSSPIVKSALTKD